MLRLVGVTPDTWRCPLSVAPEQKEFVADRVLLPARAYVYRADRSHAVFLVEGKTGAGMALWRDCGQGNAYIPDDLFIDVRCQGRGYSTAALALILEGLRQEGKFPPGDPALCGEQRCRPAILCKIRLSPEFP